MTIQEELRRAINKLNCNKIENSVLKARILLAYILNVKKEYLVIHSDEEIDSNISNKYNDAIDKLLNYIPLQYITNHQEFMKLDFYVNEKVLIPRADTEILVEEVIEKCNKNPEKSYKILDLCSGSGAIGISIAKYVENSNVVCADISEEALNISRKNANINEVKNIKFIKSNMFQNIENDFEIIVSNPPYIKKNVILGLDKEVQNEPHIALDGGTDGLDFYRIIANEAYKHLKPNGSLFLEIGYDQKEEVSNLIKINGKYKNIYSKKDLYGNDRIIACSL